MPTSPFQGQRVLVTGAAGQLGRYLRHALQEQGATTIGLGAHAADCIDITADITDAIALETALANARPDAVIHAAAYTDVDGCERDPARAEAVNSNGSRHVAAAARAAGAYVIAVSTDFVFSGDGGAPYAEEATPGPLSVYGRSKLAGEEAVLALDSGFAVARTAWLYGGPGKHFPRTVLTLLRDRGSMEVVDDEAGSPTFAGDLATAVVSLLAVRGAGIFHLVNSGRSTRFGLAQEVAKAAGFDPGLIISTTTAAFLAKSPLPARRPADSTLANCRAAALGITLRPWSDAVADYVPRLAAELDLAGGCMVPQGGRRAEGEEL
jgi:dTDP-4-dehydrorhamnose reductase